MTREPETARFYALLDHFHRARCCRWHAVFYAIRTIEREAGRSFDTAPAGCKEPSVCEAAARHAWADRPKLPRFVPQGRPSGEAAQDREHLSGAAVDPCEQLGATAQAGGSARARVVQAPSASSGPVALEGL